MLPRAVFALLVASFARPCFSAWHDAFADPPIEFRPKFRYWLPDASVPSDAVVSDVWDAKAVGAGGLEILPFYLYGMGEETFHRFAQQDPSLTVPMLPDWNKYGFGTPAFLSLFKAALQAAEEAGILIDYALGPNQGQGIPSEPGSAGLAVQLLMGNTTISPRGSFSAPVPQPRQPSDVLLSGMNFMHPLEQFGTPNLTAVIAYEVLNQTARNQTTGARSVLLNQSSFLDLTDQVKDGWALQWTPPDLTKTWKIFTFWEAFTNQRSCDGGPNATNFISNGSWTVDHFSSAGATRITEFWDDHILSDTEIKGLIQKLGKYAWEDSMEILASLYWTPGLLDRFQNKHGYQLLPYLPVLFSQSNTWGGFLPVYNEMYSFGGEAIPGSSIHQLDYRSILNDGYRDYLSHFRNWTHSIGSEYSTQPAYNLPLQMLSDIPLVDAPEGESLGFGQLTDAYRQFAGPAHLGNRGVISTELGAVRVPAYSLRIPDLLQQIKRSFAGGFNMNVLHGFPASTTYPNTTWPGYTTFFYEFTEMWNRIQPAWRHMKDSLDFVARNQWVLQQGHPRIDLVFYSYSAPWSPRTQYKSTNLRDLGYTYDYLGPENLASPDASIKDFALGIPKYRAIILNQQTVATVEAMQSLISFASFGLPVIIIGAPPNQVYPVTLSNQANLTSAAKRLLSIKNVYQADSHNELPSLLLKLNIHPRVALNCTSNPVYSVLRSSEDVDYVYFFNDQSDPSTCTATFALGGVTPHSLNAWTGERHRLLQYATSNTTLSTTLSLASNETKVLAFTSGRESCTFPQTTGSIYTITLKDNTISALITGPSTLFSSDSQQLRLNPNLPSATFLRSWDLQIHDWHSSPDRFAISTSITTHTLKNITLIPWKQISPTLAPASGQANYTTFLPVPSYTPPSPSGSNSSLVAILKLPNIQHTARLFLNDVLFPPFDPVNPTVILGALTSGKEYEVKIEISTTLFNRIKADANETMVVGQVAGKRQPLYNTLPFEEYGLIGDVTVEWGVEVEVHC